MALSNRSLIGKINDFLASPYYLIALTAVSMAAHLLALELWAYTFFTLVVLYSCIIGNELLPVAPLFLFSYILPSAGNNPGKHEGSIFATPWFFVLAALVVLAFSIFIFRNLKRLFSGKKQLLPGILALCLAYLLSGIGSAAYPDALVKNLTLAAIQGISLVLPYLLILGGVDWKNVRKDYLGWIGVCAGCLLVFEVLANYLQGGVIVDGVIDRKKIFTGWGMYNNMGVMLAMMIPLAFSLTHRYKKDWLGLLVGGVFLVGVILTCSRTSMVAALGIYGVCALLLLFHSPNRKKAFLSIGGLLALVVIVMVIFRQPLLQLFSAFLAKLTDPSSRHVIFAKGWEQFVSAPIFGTSFFSPGLSKAWDFSTLDSFSSLFPPRWHNTFVQLLASCGIIGVVAYVFHRVQTVQLFFRHKGTDRMFYGCSILALLVCCLLDCHFFNIGPVLFYSVIFAFTEAQTET